MLLIKLVNLLQSKIAVNRKLDQEIINLLVNNSIGIASSMAMNGASTLCKFVHIRIVLNTVDVV